METIGSLIDKLSINELKIYHMTEQRMRSDITDTFREDCDCRLSVLREQKKDLIEELKNLAEDVGLGRRELKLYRQMKMYNEKKFRD